MRIPKNWLSRGDSSGDLYEFQLIVAALLVECSRSILILFITLTASFWWSVKLALRPSVLTKIVQIRPHLYGVGCRCSPPSFIRDSLKVFRSRYTNRSIHARYLRRNWYLRYSLWSVTAIHLMSSGKNEMRGLGRLRNSWRTGWYRQVRILETIQDATFPSKWSLMTIAHGWRLKRMLVSRIFGQECEKVQRSTYTGNSVRDCSLQPASSRGTRRSSLLACMRAGQEPCPNWHKACPSMMRWEPQQMCPLRNVPQVAATCCLKLTRQRSWCVVSIWTFMVSLRNSLPWQCTWQ